ncbi:MAG: hypothetical protein NXI24_10280 [bacterium]|nr:hypothetical protein [bacterium]
MFKRATLIVAIGLIAGLAACKTPTVAVLSTIPVEKGDYKLSQTNLSYQNTYVTFLGIPVTEFKGYAITTSEAQKRYDCAFLRNVALDYRQGGFLGVGLQTFAVTFECWVSGK